ncbi:hypothetical protein [Piscinibacter gummiphilus]|uniref:hypothetical protein n=1 Tax=Piscinibacter gummiphilus TaxID=946333 RepID=UPI0012F48C17|nr:hypothetical protein [Piscinibacter gummiphilus]GLS95674.1 hypothetical protein GCM10007918_29660 [Piscinibacter gummiphilus]
MRFDDLPLHDATLSSVHACHETGRCDLTLRLGISGTHVLRFEGFNVLSVPRQEPWGPSCAVNATRQVSPRAYELELQSGDVIHIEARSWTFQKRCDEPPLVSGHPAQMRAAFMAAEAASGGPHVATFVLGKPSPSGSPARAAVEVCRGAETRWRIDLCDGLGESGFQDVRCVGDVVYVGYGQQVAVVSPMTGRVASYPLAGYFGHLFTAEDLDSKALGRSVLVSSASELLCFDAAGERVWRTTDLAIDGVIVHRVVGDAVEGSAEWDPPGGWRPFRLNLQSGKPA